MEQAEGKMKSGAIETTFEGRAPVCWALLGGALDAI
jgi:hypothetical protein